MTQECRRNGSAHDGAQCSVDVSPFVVCPSSASYQRSIHHRTPRTSCSQLSAWRHHTAIDALLPQTATAITSFTDDRHLTYFTVVLDHDSHEFLVAVVGSCDSVVCVGRFPALQACHSSAPPTQLFFDSGLCHLFQNALRSRHGPSRLSSHHSVGSPVHEL